MPCTSPSAVGSRRCRHCLGAESNRVPGPQSHPDRDDSRAGIPERPERQEARTMTREFSRWRVHLLAGDGKIFLHANSRARATADDDLVRNPHYGCPNLIQTFFRQAHSRRPAPVGVTGPAPVKQRRATRSNGLQH